MLQIKVKDGYRFNVSPRSGESQEQACERIATFGFLAPPMQIDDKSQQFYYPPHNVMSIEIR